MTTWLVGVAVITKPEVITSAVVRPRSVDTLSVSTDSGGLHTLVDVGTVVSVSAVPLITGALHVNRVQHTASIIRAWTVVTPHCSVLTLMIDCAVLSDPWLSWSVSVSVLVNTSALVESDTLDGSGDGVIHNISWITFTSINTSLITDFWEWFSTG